MAIIKNLFSSAIILLTFSIVWFIINLAYQPEVNPIDKVVIKFENENHHIDLSDMQDPKEVITTCYGFICKVSVKHFEVVKRKRRK